ncbi:ATP-dependent DNA helicase, RecQ family, partial [Thiovulum sp. ES]
MKTAKKDKESRFLAIDIDENRVGVFPKNVSFTFSQFKRFNSSNYIFVGHNIVNYDKPILEEHCAIPKDKKCIDTLYLSILLQNEINHKLRKDYKSSGDKNNPIEDAKESLNLLEDLTKIFKKLPLEMRESFAYLSKENKYYKTFLEYVGLVGDKEEIALNKIREFFPKLEKNLIEKYPIETLVLLFSKYFKYRISSYALINYPKVKTLLNEKIDVLEFTKEKIGNPDFKFKDFDSAEFSNKKISQKEIVESAIEERNVLAVLPTGGGKSLTFQIPAIYEYEKFGGLTVIISPLRALIKDQVNGFNEKFKGFAKAVALSSFLADTEKKENIRDLKNGKANILYIAPESLRYKTVLSIFKERHIARIVLDEAHVLSTWGKDFRPDYRYIANFINEKLEYLPKISCFTATATKYVLDDIRKFFNEIGVYFHEHIALNTRENIKYSVLDIKNDKARYSTTKEILEQKENVPAIVYITQSRKKCDEVAGELQKDFGDKYKIESFHSKVANREQLSEDFVEDKIDIIVSTSAFGMGVDKPNVKTVIHYKPSSNIEDYLQESGRGGRDGKNANSIVLYRYDDLNFHFDRLKNSIDTPEEIRNIYEALKRLSYRNRVITSTKEIIKEANWDELSQQDFEIQELKIGNILAELERVKLIVRDTNIMKMLGNSFTTASISKNDFSKLENSILKYLQKGKIENIYEEIDGTEKEIDFALENLHKKGVLDFERSINFEFKNFNGEYFEVEKIISEHALQNSTLKLKELSNSSKLQNFKFHTKKQLIGILESILVDWNNNKIAKSIRVDKSSSTWNFKAENNFLESVLNKIETAQKIYSQIENEKKIDVKSLEKYSSEKYSLEYFLLLLQNIGAIKLKDKISPFSKQYKLELLDKHGDYTKENYQEEKEVYYDYRKKRVHIMNEYLQNLLDEQKNGKTQKLLLEYFKLDISDFISRYFPYLKEMFENFQTKDTQFGKDLSDEQRRVMTSKANSIMILAGPGSGKTHTLVHKIAHTIKNDSSIKPEQFLMLTHTRTAVNEFRNRLFK